MRFLRKWAKRALAVFAVIAVTFFAVRIYQAERGPPLERWHTYFPYEMSAKELDRTDWPKYLAAEAEAFDAVGAEITQKLAPEDRIPIKSVFRRQSGLPAPPAE